MYTLKLTPIGNSVGVILPDEILARLKVEKGDSIFVRETPEGLTITAQDPALKDRMKAAQAIMKKRRNVLRELAK